LAAGRAGAFDASRPARTVAPDRGSTVHLAAFLATTTGDRH
jgi:hypothetical protein